MKCLNRGCTAFVLVSVMVATAQADDPPAASAPAASAPAAPEAPAMAPTPTPEPAAPRKFIGAHTGYYITGGVSDSPFWSIGITLPPGISLAVGLNVNYDRNGLTIPGMTTRSTDKFSFEGLLYGSYYFYNKFPFGIAAEAAIVAPLAPSAFDPVVVLQPGVGIYYAPFNAPIVLGSGLDLSITLPKGDAKASVKMVTPGLRIIYAF